MDEDNCGSRFLPVVDSTYRPEMIPARTGHLSHHGRELDVATQVRESQPLCSTMMWMSSPDSV